MIQDNQTNFLYLANTLQAKKYSAFLERFKKELNKHFIPFGFLPNTKDIWAVDYMPIQIDANKFVQFVYNPDYLRNDEEQRKTIPDVDEICQSISFARNFSAIVLDGGNVIRSADTVIMCDKIFKENPNIPENILIKLLKNIFEVERIIFIPWDKSDFTGHVDGMVRFVDSDTIFINNYSKQKTFQKKFIKVINDSGLKYIEIPYNPYGNANDDDAMGIYMNYLQMKDIVFVPIFGMKEDDIAIKQFEQYFKTVVPIESNIIAKYGGILNCISWNIMN